MDHDEREFAEFRHLTLHGSPPDNQLQVTVGCYPSFRLVSFSIGPSKGYGGSDRFIGLTRSEARTLAGWILEQLDG